MCASVFMCLSEFVRGITYPLVEGYSNNLAQMFASMRLCVMWMNQVSSLKAKVTFSVPVHLGCNLVIILTKFDKKSHVCLDKTFCHIGSLKVKGQT